MYLSFHQIPTFKTLNVHYIHIQSWTEISTYTVNYIYCAEFYIFQNRQTYLREHHLSVSKVAFPLALIDWQLRCTSLTRLSKLIARGSPVNSPLPYCPLRPLYPFTLYKFGLSEMKVDNHERNYGKIFGCQSKTVVLDHTVIWSFGVQRQLEAKLWLCQKFRTKFSQCDCCHDPHLQTNQSEYDMKWHRIHWLVWHFVSDIFKSSIGEKHTHDPQQ